MNVLVVGLGSMGKRRIRILQDCENVTAFGVDSSPERRNEAAGKFGIAVYASLEEAVSAQHMDAVLVCSPPLSHAEIIRQCLLEGMHVFAEINLMSDGYEENLALAKEKNLVLFISSPGLYREDYIYMIDAIHKSASPINYIYHIGQYLPDWHPWENYENFFVGNPKSSGCRELFSVELPWLITAFGDVQDVSTVKSKNSSLKVNYNDNYLVLLTHSSGAKGVLAIDVVSRKAVRRLEVFSEDMYFTWEGNPDSLVRYDIEGKTDRKVSFSEKSEYLEGYQAFTTENPFRSEIDAFLAKINNPSLEMVWDFERDKSAMEIIDRIEAQ